MIHQRANVQGELMVKMQAEDWVWLCELLADILREDDLDPFCRDDTAHALSALGAFERAV